MTWLRAHLCALIVTATALLASWAGGSVARAAGSLPEIVAHSKLEIALHQGDVVALEVRARGEGLQAKWVTGEGTLCRSFTCELATGGWALGTHRISFVVFNANGSLFLRYVIRILPPLTGAAGRKVEVELEDAGAGIEPVAAGEFGVKMIAGRGFSYHLSKLQVVGPTARAIEWDERLKTQSGGAMQVGLDDVETHTLADESSATLATTVSGRRVVILGSGAVRSRQLDGEAPRWSVVVPDWLQVDTDGLGDVLVEMVGGDPDTIAVTALRGAARVFVRKPGETDKKTDGRRVPDGTVPEAGADAGGGDSDGSGGADPAAAGDDAAGSGSEPAVPAGDGASLEDGRSRAVCSDDGGGESGVDDAAGNGADAADSADAADGAGAKAAEGDGLDDGGHEDAKASADVASPGDGDDDEDADSDDDAKPSGARAGGAGTAVTGQMLVVPAGSEMILVKGMVIPPHAQQPDPERVERRVLETTPWVLGPAEGRSDGTGARLLRDDAPTSLAAAVALAKDALQRHDPMVAVEALLPFLGAARKNAAAQTVLGEAYLGLALHEAARTELRSAIKHRPKAARAQALLGMSHMASKQWKAALRYFDAAELHGFSDMQVLKYYQGVAAHNAGDPVKARASLQASLWQARDQVVAASARRFLREATAGSWLSLRFGLGATYDGNVLRASADAAKAADPDLKKNAGPAYLWSAALTLWPVRRETGDLGGGYEVAKRGFSNSQGVNRLDELRQRIWARGGLNVDGDEQSAALWIGVGGYFETITVGSERADDALGTRFEVGSPALAGLVVWMAARYNVDPLPDRNDLYDPVLQEPAGAGDRSSRQSELGAELKPWRGDQSEVGLSVRSQETAMLDPEQASLQRTELGIGLSGAYDTSARNRLRCTAAQVTRNFTEETAARKTRRLDLGAGWTWRYTTSLRHELDLESQKQTSPFSDETWSRLAATWQWLLEF
jgi:Tfp pilus assembly protein PilF